MTVANQCGGWTSVKHIVLVFLVVCFPSCYPAPEIPLSPEEEKLCAALAREYACEVSLSHDYYSVSGNGSNGTFYVWLESRDEGLCSRDSAYFITTSSKIANDVTRIMRHKENYRSVTVTFHIEKSTEKDLHQTLCSREVDIRVDSSDVAVIRTWWTPKEHEWAPSDHIIER